MRSYLPDYHLETPGSLAEALELLAREPGQWQPLAGGTDLMVGLNAGTLKARGLLDLSRCQDLRGIREQDGVLALGSLTSFTELLDCPAVARHFPSLAQSARSTGALAIQNRGTLGGNLANASPAADTPPSLLVYAAELELVSVRGRRRVPYERFHLGYKQLDLAPDELLACIRVPVPAGPGFHFFRKVGTRQALAITKISLAAYGRLAQGRLAELRVALGSAGPVPLRARAAEAVLQGRSLAELAQVLPAARAALMADISPIDDIRSTAHYRRVTAGNLLEQMVGELLQGAGRS